jgi:hypothetical protein
LSRVLGSTWNADRAKSTTKCDKPGRSILFEI